MGASFDTAVVGAGIVGVSCALCLQRAGRSVVLIDRDEPGNGASFGNAGNFATWGVLPLNAPGLVLRVPGMLASSTGPLAIKWRGLPAVTPWLVQFLLACEPSRVEAASRALAALMARAEAAAMPLFEAAGGQDLLSPRGIMHLYPDARAAADGARDNARMTGLGVALTGLSRDEALDLEPNLAPAFHSAVMWDEAFSIRDPRALVQRMARHFAASGGTAVQDEVIDIREDATGMTVGTASQSFTARDVVIAAGAWSKRIPGAAPDRMLLDTERGYHVVFPGGGNQISRSVGWGGSGFYMTPMAGGLRAAGTVELGGLDAPPSKKRLAMIASQVRRLLPDLGPHEGEWLGFRPSLPDSLPVIGRSPRTPGIVYAVGHQHLGMTLGGVTGEIVAAIVTGQAPPVDIAAFAPDRF